MEARQAWRRNVNQLLTQWRREIVEQVKTQTSQTTTSQAAKAQAAHNQALQKAQAEQALQDEVKYAQIDVDKAHMKLEAAQRVSAKAAVKLDLQQFRQSLLAEASKTWVTRDSLAARINEALDAPQPFGFTGNIVTHPVFTHKSAKSNEQQEEGEAATPMPAREGRPLD